ncbi:MAG: efflux RND transporter periplasmic adaptor subunit [Planctomycetes bacterium]|nr:efflux RND transporter periplasmic adaptor subunit [Planctomycetota bacterium]
MKHPNRASIVLIPGSAAILLVTLALAGCDGGGGGGGGGHDGHDDHGPPGASSNEVALTGEQAKSAGLRVQVAGPAKITERLRLTAVVHENLDTQAHVTPKVPGLVRSIRKQLGDHVEANEILCELESTELGQAASAYMEARASLQAARRILEQETVLLERGVQVAQTIFNREKELKDKEISTLRPYYEAEKELGQARLTRDSRVLALGGEITQREIRLHTAEERLRILGLSAEDLQGLDKDEEHGHGRYLLRAPRAGVIVARDLTENEFVDTSSKLFLIQDLTRVWVVASVFEGDLRRVERGQAAEVRLEAFPGVTLKGKVTFINYRVDPTSRACEVRIELPNDPIPGWKEPFPLRPGLFGTVDLIVAEHAAEVAVPEKAIVHEGELTYVFVALDGQKDGDKKSGHDDHDDHKEGSEKSGHDDHDDHKEDSEKSGHDDHDDHDDHDAGPKQRFVRREVEIGARGADRVEIKRGLKAGDRVVVEGTFTLKSAARQGELGGGHSH